MIPLPSDISLSQVIHLDGAQEFNEMAMKIFFYQRENNLVYNAFLEALGRPSPQSIEEIPCLPIGMFKQHRVVTGAADTELQFASSGTSGQVRARHHLLDLSWYETSFMRHFEQRYGSLEECCVLGLLPSYIEQGESSLVYMVDRLIQSAGHRSSGTFLYDHSELRMRLGELNEAGVKTILIGVTYALLDFIEEERIDYPELIVMETGGMKGRRKEMIREELHALLKAGFGVDHIHSEYGMTELLSQAYAASDGRYHCPPWMQVRVRDIMDPFATMADTKSGGLNIIDLANVHSCAFISSDDLARKYADGSFEVLGRFDQSDIRGCSLLI